MSTGRGAQAPLINPTNNKNGILLTHREFSGCHFVFLPMTVCVDFQKCVDFWFRLKKCVDLRRFISFVGLYQSWQGFFCDQSNFDTKEYGQCRKSRGFSTMATSSFVYVRHFITDPFCFDSPSNVTHHGLNSVLAFAGQKPFFAAPRQVFVKGHRDLIRGFRRDRRLSCFC